MKRAANVREIRIAPEKRDAKLRPLPVPVRKRPVLMIAHVDTIDDRTVTLTVAGERVQATLDASVHPTVIAGACERRERVLVEEDHDGALTVVGALRTQPTPGIDVADTYTIRAERIALEAGQDVTLTAKTAALALRAVGEIESYADRIVSRAEGVHKIIGRMLRLN